MNGGGSNKVVEVSGVVVMEVEVQMVQVVVEVVKMVGIGVFSGPVLVAIEGVVLAALIDFLRAPQVKEVRKKAT